MAHSACPAIAILDCCNYLPVCGTPLCSVLNMHSHELVFTSHFKNRLRTQATLTLMLIFLLYFTAGEDNPHVTNGNEADCRSDVKNSNVQSQQLYVDLPQSTTAAQ